MILVDAEGGFVLRYVSPGRYTLHVTGASTQSGVGRGRESQALGMSFQGASQLVTVADTDVTDVAISLTPEESSQ